LQAVETQFSMGNFDRLSLSTLRETDSARP
jgi:hypothetical protein